MTIASQTSRISYTGDGSTVAFAVPFYFAANADLVVYLTDTLGNQTLQVLGTNYNLVGALSSSGGTCAFTTPPTSGYLITIYRDPPVTQTTSYNNNDPFPAKSHENALDKLTAISQRLKDQMARSVRQTDAEATIDMRLPTKTNRASKLLGFDSSGAPVGVLGPSFVGGTDIGAALVSTRAVAAVTTFSGSVLYLQTGGASVVGDGVAATYKRGTGTGSFTDGGGVSWVPFISGTSAASGAGGAPVAFVTPPQGRLTLVTGLPVMGSSNASVGTVYYTPFTGQQVPIYNGTDFATFSTTELSQATTDATKSPAACANNSLYDIFVWNDSGTIRATRGPAWTNDTTRSAGTALVLVNGIYLNNASITNGPAASRGTYVGTIRTNGTATVDYIFGAIASGGTAANFGVWNAYNRVLVATYIGDNTASWTYAVQNVWRAPNGSATMRISMVRGLSVDAIRAEYCAIGVAGAATNAAAGVGLDSTTAFTGTTEYVPASTTGMATGRYSGVPGIGYHYVSAIEFNNTTTASTWVGLGGAPAYAQSGLHAMLVA